MADEQTAMLSARIVELAHERRRFGYRRIHDLLAREGHADLPLLMRGQSFLEDGSVGDGVMLLHELERRQVVQAAVRSDGVEVKAPGFDDDLGVGAPSGTTRRSGTRRASGR